VIHPVRVTEMLTGTDQEYIDGCLAGRTDDFRHLVARYERAVFAYLRGRLYQPDRAQEAAQETFVRAFFNLAKLKKRDSFFPWLLGIARHVARETDRREQTDRRISAEYVEQRRGLHEIGTRPQGAALQGAALEGAVSGLPEELRQVVLLRFYADCSCLQISERLHLPLGTVTKRLSRAYARIRSRIEN
jgi:RNA polymerase sigma-70 factor (ECF subfamily)